MAITVRRATEDDLPALRENEARPDLGLAEIHFEAQQQGKLIYAVALEDDDILGTALLDLKAEGDYPWLPELRNMWVYPDKRRRGAGRALSQWLEQQAREAGHTAVYLAVDPNNEKAVPLYVSLEYHPTGEHLLVEVPEVPQVGAEQEPSDHYAVYKKSLTAS